MSEQQRFVAPRVGIVTDLDPAVYHADPCETPSLSASIANVLVSKSPAHARLVHPRFGGRSKVATDAMDRGSLIDCLLLGGESRIGVIKAKKVKELEAYDAPDLKTDFAQAHKEELRALGLVPVLRHKLDEARFAVDAIRSRFAEFAIDERGETQVALFWIEIAHDGTEVPCRALLDRVNRTTGLIQDLKTVASAHPNDLPRHIDTFGHDIQQSAYTSALGAALPDLVGRVKFEWLFCETDAPYAVTPMLPDGSMRELGAVKWQHAVNLWARCMRTGKWPAYVTGRSFVAPTQYAMQKGELIQMVEAEEAA